MKITSMGIDLAKAVLQVHGVDAHGNVGLRKQLKRKDVLSFFANLEPCLIGMEACGSAHYWARKLSEFGHTVRLMAPQFVKAYVKTNKSDRNDAEAICEAVGRPQMRFVPVKTAPMQAVLALHRARQGFVKARTAQANQIRGLLADNEPSRKLEAIAGIGPLTASAMVATLGDAKSFKNARQVPAWLGIVPRHEGTGGKVRLGGISKRGDAYLRTLLIHGARSVIAHIKYHPNHADEWLKKLLARRNKNVAAVALAAKNARIAWALLAHERSYQHPYVATRQTA